MRCRTILLLGTALALAACGQGGEGGAGNGVENAATATGSAAIANGAAAAPAPGLATPTPPASPVGPAMVQPGRWRERAELVSADFSNVPAGPERDQLEKRFAKDSGEDRTRCISDAEARRLFVQDAPPGCRFGRNTVGDGRIALEMTCEQAGKRITSTLEGTYSATRYALDQAVDGPVGGGQLKIRTRIQAERVGDCPAGQELPLPVAPPRGSGGAQGK